MFHCVDPAPRHQGWGSLYGSPAKASKITESQNCRDWKGPLEIIFRGTYHLGISYVAVSVRCPLVILQYATEESLKTVARQLHIRFENTDET